MRHPKRTRRGREGLSRASSACFFPLLWSRSFVAGTSSAQKTPWKDYLGGPDSSHYSALKQINTGNVNKLEVAWSYPTGDDVSLHLQSAGGR